MKLRNKILIVVITAWLLFLAFTLIQSKFFLSRSFLKLEATQANEDLARVDQALNQVSYALGTFTSDWSHWNDLYDYMQGKNPEFVPLNIKMTAFVNSHINFFSYFDRKGQLIIGSAVDTDRAEFTAFFKGLDRYISLNNKLLSRAAGDMRGYLLLDSGILLVASSMITDGDQLLEPIGTSVFGRLLDQSLLDRIMATTKVKLRLFLPNQIALSKNMRQVYKTLSVNENGHFSIPVNDEKLHGYTIIRDIHNHPIGMLQMTTPRSIYLMGLKAINYYLFSFTVIGILIAILLIKLIQELIIKRLERLDSVLAYINTHKDMKKRVDTSYNDELSRVSSQINDMLDIIQASHEELEKRVNERTNELQHANVQLQKEISDRELAEKELVTHKEHLLQIAHYDSLTSLPNRVLFNQILNEAMKHANQHKTLLAILFIDLDRFKKINDGLGHTTGDQVLKEVASRLSSALRKDDVLARLGGDEFIILLNELKNPEMITLVAERLLKICISPITVQHHELFMYMSIGISIYPNDGDSLETLQKNADIAMYHAKKIGGSRYEYYSEEMDAAAKEYVRLEGDLRKAIKSNQFILHYQPQINLHNKTIKRVEALIRWDHPEHGIISPDKFIPLAEETGLIIEIGEWVLNEACMQAKKWHDLGHKDIKVSVNLSVMQFKHQDIFTLVKNTLAKIGLEGHALELEITETVLMDSMESAITKLHLIHELGVQIAIDDFGVGYTSINYLRKLPINIIKIDRTFIKGLPNNINDVNITAAVMLLAHQMNLEVVAEGVETAEQYNYLREIGCDYIQGYLISPPQSANNITSYFEDTKEEQTI